MTVFLPGLLAIPYTAPAQGRKVFPANAYFFPGDNNQVKGKIYAVLPFKVYYRIRKLSVGAYGIVEKA